MFSKLAGNERIKEVLRRMLEKGRVPGGLLFVGEDGVGKRRFALELAKAMNCREPKGFEACDHCASCVRIERFQFPAADDADANKRIIWSDHPDVGMVRPAGRFLIVAQMREIEREANFRPYEGRERFFIIEEADRLNESSSNALLKTLEEPPETSHLVLLTARPAALLPTIRSRCQIIRFAPLSVEEMEKHLAGVRKMPKREANLLAHIARGSIGRALSTDLASFRERRDVMLEVLSTLALTGDRARLLRIAEEMNDAKRRDEYEPRLDVLEVLVHDVWAMRLGAPPEQIVNQEIDAQLKKISERVSSPRAARWITEIETLRGQLSVNVNRKVATDALFLSMAEEKQSG
ncbi:MAG TPA: DNA polymerase III subunit delta' C-terminal domain-containing protein [Pyrinomonadaceae bacterium]|jgi:DNA polymerase-3 subunit delta'